MKTSPAARAFVIFTVALIGTAALSIVLLFSTAGNTEKTVDQGEENFEAIKDQEAILRIILAVTGCTVADTTEQCQAKAAAGGARNIAEVDCRVRLAVAGLPAPDKGQTCVPPPPTTTTTTTTTVPPPPPPG